MAGNWCRNPVTIRKAVGSVIHVMIGERGLIAVEATTVNGATSGKEEEEHGLLETVRLLRRLAPGINMMEVGVTGRPLMPTEVLEQGLVDLALGAREVTRNG